MYIYSRCVCVCVCVSSKTATDAAAATLMQLNFNWTLGFYSPSVVFHLCVCVQQPVGGRGGRGGWQATGGKGFNVRETIVVFGNLTYYVNTCPIQEESVCQQSTNNRIDLTLVEH